MKQKPASSGLMSSSVTDSLNEIIEHIGYGVDMEHWCDLRMTLW